MRTRVIVLPQEIATTHWDSQCETGAPPDGEDHGAPALVVGTEMEKAPAPLLVVFVESPTAGVGWPAAAEVVEQGARESADCASATAEAVAVVVLLMLLLMPTRRRRRRRKAMTFSADWRETIYAVRRAPPPAGEATTTHAETWPPPSTELRVDGIGWVRRKRSASERLYTSGWVRKKARG